MILDLIVQDARLQPGWAEKAYEAIQRNLSSAPAEFRVPLSRMAQTIFARKDTLEQVAPSIFAVIVSRLTVGDEEGAYRIWLRSEATLKERVVERDEANTATLQAKVRDDQVWAEVKAVAKDLLRVVGPIAAQFLFTMVGV